MAYFKKHQISRRTVIIGGAVVVVGHGHTIIEDKRLDWAESDTMFVPPWFWYQHFNDDNDKPVRFIIWSSGVLTESLGLSEFELAEKANY